MVGSEAALAALGFARLTHKCDFDKSLKVHEFRLMEDKFLQSEPFQVGFFSQQGHAVEVTQVSSQILYIHCRNGVSLGSCFILGFSCIFVPLLLVAFFGKLCYTDSAIPVVKTWC